MNYIKLAKENVKVCSMMTFTITPPEIPIAK